MLKPSSILTEAPSPLRSEIKELHTALSNSLQQSNFILFSELINNASLENLNAVTRWGDEFGETLLHLTARNQNQAAFLAISDKLTPKMFSSALEIKSGFLGSTPLYHAVSNQNQVAFLTIIDKLNPEALSTLLVKTNNNGLHMPLMLSANSHKQTGFLSIIEKLPREVLSATMQIKASCGRTPLHEAARHQNPAAFFAIMDKLTPEDFNNFLQIENHYHTTPLDLVARNTNLTAFLAICNKINLETLSAALLKNYPDTPLHQAASHQDQTGFIAMLDKLTPEQLNTAVRIKNNNGQTILSMAAENKSAAAFLLIIHKLTSTTLYDEMILCNKQGNNLLHTAASNPNQAAFLVLIDKLTPEALNDAIQKKDHIGQTLLHLAALRANQAVILAISEKLTPNALNLALQEKNNAGLTALHLAARHRNNGSIQELMNSIDPSTVFKIIFLTQDNKDSIRLLISDAFFHDDRTLIREKFLTDKTILRLTNLIWQRIKSGDQLIENLEFRKKMLSALMRKPSFSLSDIEMNLFQYLKKTTPLPTEDFSKIINWHLSDQASTQNSGTGFMFLMNKTLFSGYIPALNLSPEAIQLPPPPSTADKLSRKINNNEILIKIVRPDCYNDFLKQLGDYNHRPKLRQDKHNSKFKFVHLTGKVVSYQYHAQKNKPAYTHTKKSSMTLIGSHLQTPVFGQHDTTRPQVGYLFDTNDCIIKAMLRQDKGTFKHQWLGATELDAENAGLIIPNYNFTDKNEFCNSVNSDASITNEVLAKVKKEAIVAIVITRKNTASIDIAKERQKDARDKLGINVPIVFYDAQQGTVDLIQEELPNTLNAITRSPTC